MNEIIRERNRRGEGTRLRAEILAGATELLERTGSEEAVTLRAVARQVGISAPSIYSHFPDREAIVDAIVDGAFSDFNAAIKAASEAADEAGDGPLVRVRAGCAAYLRFAAERPNRYRLLFQRRDILGDGQRPFSAVRIQSLDLLIDSLRACVDAGISASTDPELGATAIWAALHGFATLHADMPGHPWPDTDALLDRIIDGLAEITSEP
ncbi:MAG TPA: TetR/AcrR family transcriptional regulator [Streptosporangiaceae bacterium]|nr:TetR/AcrR family transcriptional regulator [Streptosporangiaceae bacterium]